MDFEVSDQERALFETNMEAAARAETRMLLRPFDDALRYARNDVGLKDVLSRLRANLNLSREAEDRCKGKGHVNEKCKEDDNDDYDDGSNKGENATSGANDGQHGNDNDDDDDDSDRTNDFSLGELNI